MRVFEIFSSINGEICNAHQGSLCTFIRFSWCNLRCTYCDTKYAQNLDSGRELTIPQIIKAVRKQGNKNITITGGEPLLQIENLKALLYELEESYNISIETNGSYDIRQLLPFSVSIVMDYKLPSSEMEKFMYKPNLDVLTRSEDILKFVVADEKDFNRAIEILKKYGILATVAFSPVKGMMDSRKLAIMMSESSFLKKRGAVLSLQLHKLLDLK